MFLAQDIMLLGIVLISPGFSILKAGFLAYLEWNKTFLQMMENKAHPESKLWFFYYLYLIKRNILFLCVSPALRCLGLGKPL